MPEAEIDLARVPAAPPAAKNARATSWPPPISANVPSVGASRLSARAFCLVVIVGLSMGFYPFECFDAPLSSSQQQGGGTSDPPGLRGRLRNERAAYEGQGGKTISRLTCRTVGSPAEAFDTDMPHTTSRRVHGRSPMVFARHDSCEGLTAMLRITDILDMPADGRATWTLRLEGALKDEWVRELDRKSTRLNSSHLVISYAVFCLKKKKRICSISTVCFAYYSGNSWSV